MKKLNFLSFFRFKFLIPLLTLFAVITALWSSSLIAIINNKIVGTPLPLFKGHELKIFIFFISTSFLFNYLFQAYLVRTTLVFGNELILSLIDKLRRSNYESFISLGEAKVRTAITDIMTLESLPGIFISALNSVIMIIVIVGYMFWMYSKGAIAIVLLIIVLVLIYLYRTRIIEKNLNKARDYEEIFMRYYNDFLHGFNKLKMSTKRSDAIYYEHIKKNRDASLKVKSKSQLAALLNNLIGEYVIYILIGTILFVLPFLFQLEKEIIAGFIVAVLFLIEPVSSLIHVIEIFVGYKIAFTRLNNLDQVASDNADKQGAATTQGTLEDFRCLKIKDIEYHYLDELGKASFKLKPVNIHILKGEVLFIQGGNGSGKSTFMNLLSGLYIPKNGELYFNDTIIRGGNRAEYRDKLSCIFSDNYLFTENYDSFKLQPTNKLLHILLKKMSLDKIIRPEVLKNKIIQELSSGQKKRLALIYSILEDKDIYIFDEWAAEQDPEFRKYFYESIIPELKSKGKTVIAITHDDAYYSFCDRRIKFEFGKMEEISSSVLI